MKIVFVNITQGHITRGAEYATHLEAEGLVGLNNNSVYLFGSEKNSEKKYTYNYEVVKLNSRFFKISHKPKNLLQKILDRFYLNRQTLALILFYIKSFTRIKRINPDIIVVVNGAVSLLLAKILFRKSKIVIFGQAGFGYHDFDNLRVRPDLFISLSPDLSLYKRYINKNTRITYIPNPVDTNFFKPIKFENLSLKFKQLRESNKLIVLTVAALVPYKRVPNVINACRYIKDPYLIIAGSGEQYNDVNHLCKQILNGKYMISTFSRDDILNLYNICDVFVLASEEREAFGTVILEALACGKPVICNNDPIRKEIAGNLSDILVDCSHPEKIAEKINNITKTHNEIKRERYINRAKEYDYKNIGKKINNEFLSLIDVRK